MEGRPAAGIVDHVSRHRSSASIAAKRVAVKQDSAVFLTLHCLRASNVGYGLTFWKRKFEGSDLWVYHRFSVVCFSARHDGSRVFGAFAPFAPALAVNTSCGCYFIWASADFCIACRFS